MYFVCLIHRKQKINNILICSETYLPSQTVTENKRQLFFQKRRRRQNVWEWWWTIHLNYSPDWRGQREKNVGLTKRVWRQKHHVSPLCIMTHTSSVEDTPCLEQRWFLQALKVANYYSQQFLLLNSSIPPVFDNARYWQQPTGCSHLRHSALARHFNFLSKSTTFSQYYSHVDIYLLKSLRLTGKLWFSSVNAIITVWQVTSVILKEKDQLQILPSAKRIGQPCLWLSIRLARRLVLRISFNQQYTEPGKDELLCRLAPSPQHTEDSSSSKIRHWCCLRTHVRIFRSNRLPTASTGIRSAAKVLRNLLLIKP